MDHHRDIPAFDAYGDPLSGLRPHTVGTAERRARTAGIAVFWALALLIVAGRVHYGPVIGGEAHPPIELAAR